MHYNIRKARKAIPNHGGVWASIHNETSGKCTKAYSFHLSIALAMKDGDMLFIYEIYIF